MVHLWVVPMSMVKVFRGVSAHPSPPSETRDFPSNKVQMACRKIHTEVFTDEGGVVRKRNYLLDFEKCLASFDLIVILITAHYYQQIHL